MIDQFGTTDEEATTGLMTFPFGSIEDVSKYVDCGWIDRKDFKGPFLDYLREVGNAQFRGRVDLRVGKIRKGRTRVSVHARYTVSASSKKVDRFSPQTYSWAFASGGSATVRARRWMTGGKWVFRTCRPTYAAERAILDKLGALVARRSGLSPRACGSARCSSASWGRRRSRCARRTRSPRRARAPSPRSSRCP